MLIFVLQTIWLFISELAGKDLDLIVVFKFLIYYSPKLMPLVLPLTILLSSIMVFGNFAENYEFAAMKSTGISLQRAMASLGIFIGILGITTFFFSNNVIPWGEYNSYNLRKNIAKLKPAMVIAPGQFNEVGNYNIKVDSKSGERGQDLKNVIIHKRAGSVIGNYTTIVSKTGKLIGNEESNVLKLILNDGYFYDDTPPKKVKEREKHPFNKSTFKQYTINVDLSQHNNFDLEEKNVTDKYNMLNVSDLNYTIDSLAIETQKEYAEFSTNLYNRSNIEQLNVGITPRAKRKDSTFNGNVLDLFNTRKKVQLLDLALNNANSTSQIISSKDNVFKAKNINYNKHIIALHEKFALGFACIILFFVGAPLGALIRKGGIGLPMVVAILLFLTYHFIGIFAKNSAKDGSLNPILATWFSTLIMLPLGIYLTKRATADRGLFEFDHIIVPLKELFRSKSKTPDPDEVTPSIIKTEDLPEVDTIRSHYAFNSKASLVFYIVGLILFILFFVFKNNKLPNFASASIQLSAVSLALLIVYYVKSFININGLYALVQEKTNTRNPLLLILGLVFYPLTHYLRRNKIRKDFTDSLK